MKRIIISLLIIGIIFYGYKYVVDKYITKATSIVVDQQLVLENETISVTKYYIYGTHLNIYGNLTLSDTSNIKDISLVLHGTKNKNIDITYTIKNNIVSFYVSNYINNGIDLESLYKNSYNILLKVTTDTTKYYTLNNTTSYKNLTYYTMSSNSKQIDLVVDQLLNTKPSFKLNINNISPKDDIYDIVIDPGHGGIDGGASNDSYEEKKMNLTFANKLKEELTSLGYKVKLTRTDNTSKIDTYINSGRVAIPYLTKAKLLISIHHNSADYNNTDLRGFEIYLPYNMDTSLAKELSTNMKTIIDPSTNLDYKIDEGVYCRTFTNTEISEFAQELKADNKAPHNNITTDTPYYYILRETGGMITGAYVDERDNKGPNEYRNYNIAAETYLLELGYISNNHDLNILNNNVSNYANVIAKTIENRYK